MSNSAYKLSDGSELTKSNYDDNCDRVGKSVKTLHDDLQVLALFAFDHYKNHGQTAFITKLYQAVRITRGARIGTMLSWIKSVVNVVSTGKGADLTFKSDKKVEGHVYLIQPSDVCMWYDHDDNGEEEKPTKDFTFDMMVSRIQKIAENELGERFTVGDDVRKQANAMLAFAYANRDKPGSVSVIDPKPQKPAAAAGPQVDTSASVDSDVETTGDAISEFDQFTDPATATG